MSSTTYGSATASGADGREAARAALEAARGELDPTAVEFVATFVSPTYDYQRVVDTLREETDGATLIGASSAGEFTEDGATSGSVAVAAVASDDMQFYAGLGTGLSEDVAGAVASATDPLPDTVEGHPHAVGINLHDGLLGRGEEVVMRTYQQRPMTYVGGSAADDRRLEETVVFANDTVATDAVAVGMIASKEPFGTAVGHAHRPVSEGYRVTAAEGSVVHELDGRPAYEVWADAVREHAASDLGVDVADLSPESDRFRELLTRYEFGVQTGDDQYKVRWPGLTPDREGPLQFATEIPEGAELFVMDADPEATFDAQSSVADAAADGNTEYAGGIVFDCICQADILGDRFSDAVASMGEAVSVPLAGMEVYGEVGVDHDDMRMYHNATSSVLLLPA